MGFKKKTMTRIVLLLAMLIASSASDPIAENNPNMTTEIPESREDRMIYYRLPNNTIPRLYHVHIEPNMDEAVFTWTGETSIDIEVIDPTSLLTLHAYKNLAIDENFTKLVDADGTKLTPIKHNRDYVVEFLKLQFDHEIPAGNYSLSFRYEGSDTGDFVGFYKSSYRFGDTPTVVGTHFEATTARRAFPCWDEPGLKARFRMSIKHFPNYTAVSNMPELGHVETPDGKILTTFDTTPIMSTYVLTFVVSDYKNIFNEHGNVSLHTSRRALEEVRYLVDLSPEVVRVMESYTGFPFGFPRIGSVLMPIYSAAATEHWGLVTYGEAVIRINATLDTTSRKDSADMLIAHELSHAWFGNRVTPLWWDDLWLNEAFAAYFQYYIMDEIYDNWGGIELFILRNNQEAAFPADTANTIPVRWTPITNKEIRLLFGHITYRKGSAIVHMFRYVLGDDAFQAGIQKFMAKHSFKAAVADDLIIAFQEAYDEGPNKEKPLNLKEAITPWLVQTGYPIVNVTRNYTTGDTEVSQRSILIVDNSKKWWIPLTYATKSSLNFSSTLPASWISDEEDRVKIDGIDKDDWIVLNVRASGYYRVNYDDENWNRLADYLNTDNYKNIHVLNRAQLISDAFYLAQREPERYYRNFYKLTKYLSREVEYLPWRSAYNSIIRIEESLRYTEVHKMFERYILELMHSFIEKVGFEVRDNEDHYTKLSRADLIQWACVSGHSGCSEYAAKKLIKLAENPVENQLHPDTKVGTFCAGLRGLNDTAAKQFANWAFQNSRDLLIRNLGCTKNHEIHRNILNSLLAKNITGNSYEMRAVFDRLLVDGDENFNFAVNFFLENHQAINDSVVTDQETSGASYIVTSISDEVKTRAQLEKLKEVFLLDAVREDPKIPTTLLIEIANKNVTKADASAALFLKFWDKQLSTDNSISGSQKEHR